MSLADRRCIPCRGDVPALTRAQFEPLLKDLKDWTVIEDKKLFKSIKTRDFEQSLEIANRLGEIAEEQGHHPDLLVRWGELKIELWTHKIDGLSESDFVLAAKFDRALTR